MARLRGRRLENPDDIIPVDLLGTGKAVERREWFESRGLHRWPDQWDAIVRSEKAHGIERPDPRLHYLQADEPNHRGATDESKEGTP